MVGVLGIFAALIVAQWILICYLVERALPRNMDDQKLKTLKSIQRSLRRRRKLTQVLPELEPSVVGAIPEQDGQAGVTGELVTNQTFFKGGDKSW